MVKLSALICVQNQEAQLSQCLRKLSFCDEVVVVADRCTDRSHEIARRHGAMVIPGIFPLEDQRRAAGLTACSGDWVLELEAEDLVGSALAWEIRATLRSRPEGDYFEVPFDNYVGERLVRHGGVGGLAASSAVRLYRPGAKQWRPLRIDEAPTLSGRSAGRLRGAIRRELGRDIGGVISRLNQLTGVKAEDLADAQGATGLAGALAAGIGQGFLSLIGRGGWREGRLGVLLALLSALAPVLARLRAREILETRRAREGLRVSHAPQVVGLGGR